MVGKGHRLGPLQVGVPRQDGVHIGLGLAGHRGDELPQQLCQLIHLLAQVEPQVHGHLVVAAAGGVQPAAGVPDAGGELGLHKHVDVLGGGVDGQLAAVQIRQDTPEPFGDGLLVFGRKDALFGQHGRMGQAALDILGIHPAVEPDGRIELIGDLLRPFGRAPCPHLFHMYAPGRALPSSIANLSLCSWLPVWLSSWPGP